MIYENLHIICAVVICLLLLLCFFYSMNSNDSDKSNKFVSTLVNENYKNADDYVESLIIATQNHDLDTNIDSTSTNSTSTDDLILDTEPIKSNPIKQNPYTIRQIRYPKEDLINSQKLLEDLEINGITFPFRIRSAKDITRPLTVNEIIIYDSDALNKWCSILARDHELSLGIVIQQSHNSTKNEYILSCTDGIIDKLYIVSNPLKSIALKNLSVQNKKILRKILYEQHKKHGTVKMTVDVGFTCDSLQNSFHDDDQFKIVGLCVKRDNNSYSYPYNEIDIKLINK